ncbi:leucine--tRNA ligase [Candidatus Parcubacteria bacterium]|nr:leucine--tRNA ligase [Patescibacteria group bacterium]MBU4309520.1 leucine--tRNA ligase [Patescibacteria group bacterium]MBU4432366.1 leucine--tRNA ligase [Patescibacteria group bacterium]MBU4577226.1 leucine--tRNA ligase [Patescibacteria group bacterium]MCG2696872.1 leucine--tRNA ligase [Candidatus Parcubacteria bacterium]
MYDHKIIEKKWQQKWEESGINKTGDNEGKDKYYCLDMFPYPSGAGLHIGHVESYTATDIMSRYQRMNGKNVLHPQGWDAFGLPAENYAIKTGTHPSVTTTDNIKNFTRQIKSLGMSYDWSKEINTSTPEYYKWTQWFFSLLYKNGLAYKKKSKVNWCPKCQTVLANEQANGGVCERCSTKVEQRDLEQWFFKITDFIEQNGQTTGLLDGLNKVDWPESIKAAQRNWIGKSEGALVKFLISDSQEHLEVFTTRVDTIFGCTYCVVAPEHPLIENLKLQIENYNEVEQYILEAKHKTDLDRMEAKEKSGVELKGVKMINPFNGEEVSLFVADYVLGSYGTGAVMAVPAHDERDWEFAKKYDLKIKKSIDSKQSTDEELFTDDGVLVNSGEFTGLKSAAAREKMMSWLEEKGAGARKINYRLRDWLVSRQRYWGAPIPVIYCDDCGEVLDANLPVELPTDVDFKPTGESPLVYSKTFHDVQCPKCGSAAARRESDTMDTFVCSSWYYFRYTDCENKDEFASKESIKKWLPVDLYVGGAEHAVLHLLYARFFTKVLHNLGYIDFDEPFLKLRNQGMILAEDGRKMSKSLGNVVNPDEVVESHGADSLRMFEMFMGPLEDAKPWNTKGIVGVRKFLEKIYNIVENKHLENCNCATDECAGIAKPFATLVHKTIKKVGEDIMDFKFNTAIAQMMILVNEMSRYEILPKMAVEKLLQILAPFAPHIAEELWEKLGHSESILKSSWPQYNPDKIVDEVIQLVVQVNGKLRDTIEVASDITEEDAKKVALESDVIKKWIDGKEIVKVVVVKGKLVNIVIR